MYVLDEPTVGLHPHNTEKLIEILSSLKDIGNTVLVVEHDEEVIMSSDYLIDIGPGAGNNGGEIVFSGKTSSMSNKTAGPTSDFIFNKTKISSHSFRTPKGQIKLLGCNENNLKNVSLNIPLQCLVVVTGVSGSGKSTLVKNILYPAIAKRLDKKFDELGSFGSIGGDLDLSLIHI